MYIVGTSGHIDHGKTSLISALCGINCDRLPEEKAREMTIDIGFASIEYPRFGTVSIIDVPGHERFIRNMVVGAWGVDLALLIVAVDDGWMPQTEDHFRVLQLLGIERIIIVLNKVDLADQEMIEIVEEEIRERIEESPFEDSEIVQVSAKTGTGIEELKEAIVVNLRKLAKASDAGKPYLYVDRVFAPKGHGTVITGTLKNGFFKEEETVTIFPGNKEARIKRIESHFNHKEEGNPSQRTALNLSGVSVEDLGRGHIIVRNNFFTKSMDSLVRIELLEAGKKIRNNTELELLVGTSSIKAKLILLDDQSKESSLFVARLKCAEPWFVFPGEQFVITNPGGYRILGGGRVILPLYDVKKYRNTVHQCIRSLSAYSDTEIIYFIIQIRGYVPLSELYRMFPRTQKRTDKILDVLLEEKKIVKEDTFVIENSLYVQTITNTVDIIENNVGLNLKELADKIEMPVELAKLLLPHVNETMTIMEKEGRYYAGSSITEDSLSPESKKLLTEILQNGSKGVELEKVDQDKKKRALRELIKMDFLISLDGNIIYHGQIYEDLKERVMKLFESADKITVPEAKNATDLSRKFILPLLNRIESDGLIKRLGDFRVKS